MSDRLPRFKAAAVQAAPVFLDREASVEKACALIALAAGNGADLVVLPEVFVPGAPYWAWTMEMRRAVRFSTELYLNSVDVPSEATTQIGETAGKHGVHVVIGINERDNKSLYNTLLFFDRTGALIGKHRKLKLTGAEKLVWGEGDGSTHCVYETDIGRIGGLICGEHTMALPGYVLGAMGEQVHVASWIGFCFAETSLAEICSRYHAIAYNTFVICSQSILDQQVNQRLGLDLKAADAYSAIIEAGTGRVVAGPLGATEEGIVYADVDLNDAIPHYFIHETTGHYWPKQFSVVFDDREMKPLEFGKTPEMRGGDSEGLKRQSGETESSGVSQATQDRTPG